MNLPAKIERPELPATYEAAKTALSRCVEIDECSEYADKAKALAVYALQSKDESLYRMAVKIRARAIRRLGEMYQEVPSEQGRRDLMRPSTRSQAAASHDLSPHEVSTALRVANVPKADFEAAVESNKPATIPQLAAMGTKARRPPERTEAEAHNFRISTEGQSALRVLHEATSLDVQAVAKGATKREKPIIVKRCKESIAWLNRLLKAARRGK